MAFTSMVGTSLAVFAISAALPNIADAGMDREAKERFLSRASVVSIKEVGEGATKPLKVELEDGTVRMKAIFKTVDLRMKMETRFGSETAKEFIDSYKYEIAAYELDKLLGLEMLPVIVERKIEGKRGSIREWVADVIPHYGHNEPPPDMDRVEMEMHTVWLFDYLIYNTDRRVHNLMLGPGWSPVLIDHSMTFTTFTKPFRPMRRFPREIIERLRQLDKRAVKKGLGSYLRGNQIDAFMRRREIVLQMVEQQVAERGESEVMFALKGDQ